MYYSFLAIYTCTAVRMFGLCIVIYPGADLGFSEGGAKPSSGSLKQGVWGAAPPEAIGYLVFLVSKSKV